MDEIDLIVEILYRHNFELRVTSLKRHQYCPEIVALVEAGLLRASAIRGPKPSTVLLTKFSILCKFPYINPRPATQEAVSLPLL